MIDRLTREQLLALQRRSGLPDGMLHGSDLPSWVAPAGSHEAMRFSITGSPITGINVIGNRGTVNITVNGKG